MDYVEYILWRAGFLMLAAVVYGFMVGFRSVWNAEPPGKAPVPPER